MIQDYLNVSNGSPHKANVVHHKVDVVGRGYRFVPLFIVEIHGNFAEESIVLYSPYLLAFRTVQ